MTQQRVRTVPAGIVVHREPDPVDVALGVATDDSPAPADDTARRQQATATERQRQPGDSDTATRQATSDTAPGVATDDGDTTGDKRQATATRRHGDTANDSATDVATSPGDTTAAGRAPVATDQPEDGDRTVPSPVPGEPEPMKNRGFSFPDSLYDRAKSAMYYNRDQPRAPQTLSEFVRAAVERQTRHLEITRNEGQPWPRVARLPTGPSQEAGVRGALLRNYRRTQRPERGPADDSGA